MGIVRFDIRNATNDELALEFTRLTMIIAGNSALGFAGNDVLEKQVKAIEVEAKARVRAEKEAALATAQARRAALSTADEKRAKLDETIAKLSAELA